MTEKAIPELVAPEPIKIESRYEFDAFLMFLIQDVTKKHSADILSFFGRLSNKIITIGLEAKKGKGGIDKQIDDYFPGTSIPFHMRIKGHKDRGNWDYKANKRNENNVYNCSVEVRFPQSDLYIDEKIFDKAEMSLTEASILETEPNDIAPFIKPEIRSPVMFKKLMDEFAGRPIGSTPKRKKKDEHVQRCGTCHRATCQGLCSVAGFPDEDSLT